MSKNKYVGFGLIVLGLFIFSPTASAAQLLVLEGEDRIEANSYFDINYVATPNLESPVDYTQGAVYIRFEVTSKPTDYPIATQICMWRDSNTQETCGNMLPLSPITTTGIYYGRYRPPKQWWVNSSGVPYFQWTRLPANVRLMAKDGNDANYLVQLTGCGSYCNPRVKEYGMAYAQVWAIAHLPVAGKVQAYFTTPGHEFERPDGWEDCPELVCDVNTGMSNLDGDWCTPWSCGDGQSSGVVKPVEYELSDPVDNNNTTLGDVTAANQPDTGGLPLGVDPPVSNACIDGSDCDDINQLSLVVRLQQILNFLATGVVVVSVISLTYSGIQYATHGVNSSATAAAKNRIRMTVIGLATFAFLWTLLQWLIPGGVL